MTQEEEAAIIATAIREGATHKTEGKRAIEFYRRAENGQWWSATYRKTSEVFDMWCQWCAPLPVEAIPLQAPTPTE